MGRRRCARQRAGATGRVRGRRREDRDRSPRARRGSRRADQGGVSLEKGEIPGNRQPRARVNPKPPLDGTLLTLPSRRGGAWPSGYERRGGGEPRSGSGGRKRTPCWSKAPGGATDGRPEAADADDGGARRPPLGAGLEARARARRAVPRSLRGRGAASRAGRRDGPRAPGVPTTSTASRGPHETSPKPLNRLAAFAGRVPPRALERTAEPGAAPAARVRILGAGVAVGGHGARRLRAEPRLPRRARSLRPRRRSARRLRAGGGAHAAPTASLALAGASTSSSPPSSRSQVALAAVFRAWGIEPRRSWGTASVRSPPRTWPVRSGCAGRRARHRRAESRDQGARSRRRGWRSSSFLDRGRRAPRSLPTGKAASGGGDREQLPRRPSSRAPSDALEGLLSGARSGGGVVPPDEGRVRAPQRADGARGRGLRARARGGSGWTRSRSRSSRRSRAGERRAARRGVLGRATCATGSLFRPRSARSPRRGSDAFLEIAGSAPGRRAGDRGEPPPRRGARHRGRLRAPEDRRGGLAAPRARVALRLRVRDRLDPGAALARALRPPPDVSVAPPALLGRRRPGGAPPPPRARASRARRSRAERARSPPLE